MIYVFARHEVTTATHLGEELARDAGYLSRVVRGLSVAASWRSVKAAAVVRG